MRTPALLFGACLVIAMATGAKADGGGFGQLFLSRPARACLSHKHDFRVPGLWLGHFTGGRLIRTPGGERLLDWRDDYSCFPTAQACNRWQSRLLRRYSSQEGYRTCLPLRGGGVRIRVVRRRRASNVVVAKY